MTVVNKIVLNCLFNCLQFIVLIAGLVFARIYKFFFFVLFLFLFFVSYDSST